MQLVLINLFLKSLSVQFSTSASLLPGITDKKVFFLVNLYNSLVGIQHNDNIKQKIQYLIVDSCHKGFKPFTLISTYNIL